MKKTIILIVCMLLFSVFTVLYVVENVSADSGNNILYVGGAGEGNYSSIKDAINASIEGDTIFVYSGTYFENEIKIFKNNTQLIGENKETTIIDGSGSDEIQCQSVIRIYGENVTISGFTIKNGYHGVSILGGNNNTIKNNIITLIEFSRGDGICAEIDNGIRIINSDSNKIKNNIIKNYSSNIVFGNSSNNAVYKNNISNGSTGVLIAHSVHPYLTDISATSINNVVSENTITNNTMGISISDNLSNNIISDNTFENNRNYDIYYTDDKAPVDDNGEENGIDNGEDDDVPSENDEDDNGEDSDRKDKDDNDGIPGFEILFLMISLAVFLFWKKLI